MSSGHVFVTPIGFGKRIVAAASPFSCVRQSDDSVLVSRGSGRRLIVGDGDTPRALVVAQAPIGAFERARGLQVRIAEEIVFVPA